MMRNVVGCDVSRLLTGWMGALAVSLEVSLRVLPVAPSTAPWRFQFDEDPALRRLNEWAGQPLPINASAWWNGTLVLRLRGALAAVNAATGTLGGDLIEDGFGSRFWQGVRNQTDEFFEHACQAVDAGANLWRLSVPGTAPPLQLHGQTLIEWGGAQRWLASAQTPTQVREAAKKVGGHATLFRGKDKSAGVFAPLAPAPDRIHRDIKETFDP